MDCADRAIEQEYSDERCLELRKAVPIIAAGADGEFYLSFYFVRCILRVVERGPTKRCEESFASYDSE